MMDKKEITIPIEMYDGRFTLDEIGVLGVMLSSPHISKDVINKWEVDNDFQSTLKKLVEEEIIIFDNDKVTINIDKSKQNKNMHIKKEIQKIVDAHNLREDVFLDIENLIEEISSEYYNMGYEDGKIDFSEQSFTSYGKNEDYV